ncbi:MAG: micrococcal nuclease [Gaiellales bacterium]|nr:micrococcal nuclease [Gaiellales bacterium]
MSAPGNAPPGPPCGECDCPGLDPGLSGAARFCAVCGHPAEAHHAPVAAARPCFDCSCTAFDDGGSTGARFCANCGHDSERHPQPARGAGGVAPSSEFGLRIEASSEHGLSADREAPALRAGEAAPADTPAWVPGPPAAGVPASVADGGRYRKMKVALVVVAIVAAALVAAAGLALLLTGDDTPRTASKSPTTPTPIADDEVSKVIDGTTIKLGSGRRIKLAQVDAPKVPSNDCYSQEAVAELNSLLPAGTAVKLRAERKLDKVDKFGRRLAYVFTGTLNVNVEMVRRGAAAPYFFFGREGRYAADLVRAGKRANRTDSGLWGACPKTVLDPVHQVHTRQ